MLSRVCKRSSKRKGRVGGVCRGVCLCHTSPVLFYGYECFLDEERESGFDGN